MTRPLRARLAAVTLGLLTATTVGAGCTDDAADDALRIESTDAAPDAVLTVPAEGDGEQFPDAIDLTVGDVLEIRNPTGVGQDIGPLYAPSDSVKRWRMLSKGEFSGYCSLHPDTNFTLRVAES